MALSPCICSAPVWEGSMDTHHRVRFAHRDPTPGRFGQVVLLPVSPIGNRDMLGPVTVPILRLNLSRI